MITKKDFIRVADIIKSNIKYGHEGSYINTVGLINDICEYFKEINPNFDEGRFRKAC